MMPRTPISLAIAALVVVMAIWPSFAAVNPAANTVNTARIDPYKNYHFRIQFVATDVAGFSAFSTSMQNGARAINLNHGSTRDATLEIWATNPNHARKNVSIVEVNEAGSPISRKAFQQCWVSEYQALPDLDSNAHEVAIEHLKLECGLGSVAPAPSLPSPSR